MHKENVYLVRDNDGSFKTAALIKGASIIKERNFKIGTREFKDSFSDNTILTAWNSFLADHGKTPSPSWTTSQIAGLREKCLQGKNLKFSDELRILNAKSGAKSTKKIFAKALGRYASIGEVPQAVKGVISSLCTR